MIDEEIRSLIDKNYNRAKQILEDNIDKLHMMADALIEYETIDSYQIDKIMEGNKPGPPSDWTDDSGNSGPSDGEDGVANDTKAGSDNSEGGSIGGAAGQH